MPSQWKPQKSSIWVKIFGWLCVAVGLVGVVLPILPGIPLLFVGLAALATQHHWAHKLLLWAKMRFRRWMPRRAGEAPTDGH